MTVIWKDAFDNYGIKRVKRTDKGKNAYLPNVAQRAAIKAAGIKPASSRPGPKFDVVVLDDAKVTAVKASYYHSERVTASKKRSPEPRMGHEIISSWLNQGDQVVIGNVGAQVFAIKLWGGAVSGDEVISEIV